MKNPKVSKENKEIYKLKNPKNKITTKHLTNLDNFIQQCLDKFKFIDPKQEFYDATGDEKDIIISHKSTIPDLVIWNKKFNKNECFEEGNLKKQNTFPRFQFYLRIKSNKPDKEKKKEKKNEKDKEKNKKNKENKEKNKNKKNKENKNSNNNNNNNIPNNNNNLVNNNNNIDDNNNTFASKSEKKIFDLSDLDINKVQEYNPRHKNNFFSSNKEIIKLNDNNPISNENKYNNASKKRNLKEIGINGDIHNQEMNLASSFHKDYINMKNKMSTNNNFNPNYNPNEIQGYNDINITINNNNFIHQYQLNNSNNNINRLININNNNKNNELIFKDINNYNNNPLENSYFERDNGIINLIKFYNTHKGWIVLDSTNGNVLEILQSFELYIYLSKNMNLKKIIIIDPNKIVNLSGDKFFNILSQYYKHNINENQMQYNQLEKIRQQIIQNNLKNRQNNNINLNLNKQININNNNFNDNQLNDINMNNNFPINLNLPNNNNNNSDFMNFSNYLNYLMKNGSNQINNNINNKGLENKLNNNNNNLFNNNINFNYKEENINNKSNNDNNINNINLNNNNFNKYNSNNNENDFFSSENIFNPKGISIFSQSQNLNQNQSQEKNVNNNQKENNNNMNNENNQIEKNIIEIDDKIDNDDYYNFDNLIFNNNNKNSNSKSNIENVDDININEPGQFEPNNDYQIDNYNTIFSQFSNEKQY